MKLSIYFSACKISIMSSTNSLRGESSTVARRLPFSSVSFVNTSFGNSLISSGLMATLIQVSVLFFFSPFSVRRGLDLSPKSPNAFRDCVPNTISSGLFELVTKRLDTRSVFIKSVFIKTLRPLDPERRWTG